MQDNDDEKIIDPLIIYLSIYLFILFFFVLLNSVLRPDLSTKNNSLLSIAKVFNSDYYAKIQNIAPVIVSDSRRDYLIAMIKQIIKNHFIFLDEEKFNQQNLLRFYITNNDLFEHNSDDIKSNHNDFFNQMAIFLSIESKSNNLYLEITLNAPQINSNVENLTYRKLKAIREKLIKNGLSEEYFTIGIRGNDQQENAIFSIYTTH